MASIVVTEYAEVAVGGRGESVQAGLEPSQAVQTVASGAASAAFQPATRLIMVTSTASQRIKISEAGTLATATDTLILQGERFFGVRPGHRIANLDQA